MTDKPNKAFFMAVLVATLEGRAQTQFNTVIGTNNRNLTTADLARVQEGGAQMLMQEGVPFDNIVIQNMFLLFEGTEEDFTREANEQMTRAANEQLAQAMGAKAQPSPAEEEIASKLAESMAADPSNVQAEEQAEASPLEPLTGTGSDRDEDAGR